MTKGVSCYKTNFSYLSKLLFFQKKNCNEYENKKSFNIFENKVENDLNESKHICGKKKKATSEFKF